MPELPEVETVVRTLRPKVVGRAVRVVRLNRPDILQPAGTDLAGLLTGRTVAALDRRGKKIVFTLGDGNRFYVHLGMTGQLTAHRPEEPERTHTHLILTVGSAAGTVRVPDPRPPGATLESHPSPGAAPVEIRFRDPRRFGGVWWLGHDAPADAAMGPEPLTVTPAQLAGRLTRTRRAIKSALLDQGVVAGLGNIYVDESLHLSRIHPQTPADALSIEQIRRLNRAIKTTLRRAIQYRGSTLRDYVDGEGAAGGFQSRHKVYDREGAPCRACRTAILRIVLGGRSTHYCPSCQKPDEG